MGKSSSDDKAGKSASESAIRAALTHFDYVKLKKKKKKHDVESLMNHPNARSHEATSTAFSAKIYPNRIVFKGDKKSGKKPPIKKIKFANVERFAPDKDALAISIAAKHGKTRAVVSFGVEDEEAFTALVNNLSKTRDSARDAKSTRAQSKERTQSQPKADSTSSESDESSSDKSATIVESCGTPTVGRRPKGMITTYILWEEEGAEDLMSTDLHMPVDERNASADAQSRVKHDEAGVKSPQTQHCDCCLQRAGVNLKMPNTGRKSFAPSSDTSHTSVIQPTRNPRRYRVYRPNRMPRARSLESDISSDYDEQTVVSIEPFETRKMHRKNRYRSLPPRRKPPPRVERSAPARPSHPPRPVVRSFKPREPLDYRRAWTVDSSTSSGYTSATFQEDELELTVDPHTSGHYLHNQRRFVTGRIHREPANQRVYYRKPQQGAQRNDRFL